MTAYIVTVSSLVISTSDMMISMNTKPQLLENNEWIVVENSGSILKEEDDYIGCLKGLNCP